MNKACRLIKMIENFSSQSHIRFNEAKKEKVYKVTETKYGRFGGEPRKYTQTGTLPELIKAYGYTLETGKSWEHEKGNKKINVNPKNIKALITNLENAKNNAARDGYSGSMFEYEEVNDTEDKD